MIPYGKQWIDEEDVQAVAEVLRSDFLTTGPKIEAFERAFAEKVGAKYAVAVANGTAALHAAAASLDIGEGDEVITTPMTFAATANAVRYCGGKPVFADIDPNTYQISPAEIEKKIASKTKAVLAVDFTGQPCEYDEIRRIAEGHGLALMEDAAHSLGGIYRGKKVGSIADLTTFSFHPVKHITTGEGGMITTNDEELYRKISLFRSHGITRDRSLFCSEDEGDWYYEMIEEGYNYRMTDLQAALGISQLKKLDRFVERRKEIAAYYDSYFQTMEGIQLQQSSEGAVSSHHLYLIRVKEEVLGKSRREIFCALREAGIGVNVHYIPVYYLPYYRSLGYRRGLCPNAEALYSEAITLPLYPKMTDGEVETVVRAVRAI